MKKFIEKEMKKFKEDQMGYISGKLMSIYLVVVAFVFTACFIAEATTVIIVPFETTRMGSDLLVTTLAAGIVDLIGLVHANKAVQTKDEEYISNRIASGFVLATGIQLLAAAHSVDQMAIAQYALVGAVVIGVAAFICCIVAVIREYRKNSYYTMTWQVAVLVFGIAMVVAPMAIAWVIESAFSGLLLKLAVIYVNAWAEFFLSLTVFEAVMGLEIFALVVNAFVHAAKGSWAWLYDVE